MRVVIITLVALSAAADHYMAQLANALAKGKVLFGALLNTGSMYSGK